jgi:hypothetical protein
MVVLGDGGMTRCCSKRRPTMFAKTTKVLIAALVLAGASITFVTDASAGPKNAPTSPWYEQNWKPFSPVVDGGAG